MVNYVLIHIGKCGGSSVLEALKKIIYNLKYVHICKPVFEINTKYIITIRNPIDRFISAFNWRYHNVVTTKGQKNRYKGEDQLLKHYQNVNALAEDLYTANGQIYINLKKDKYYIHHIYEDINFYLGDFLHKCKKSSIYAVILTETLDNDLNRLFGIPKNNVPHELKNNNYSKYLSELGYSNLKKWLRKDYECILKLYKMNLITEKQYDILSK